MRSSVSQSSDEAEIVATTIHHEGEFFLPEAAARGGGGAGLALPRTISCNNAGRLRFLATSGRQQIIWRLIDSSEGHECASDVLLGSILDILRDHLIAFVQGARFRTCSSNHNRKGTGVHCIA